MRQIRRKNGTIETVDDDYILADGEGFVHSLMLMDGMDDVQRAVASGLGLGLHDGMGNPAGSRPGYVFADADDVYADADAAYAEYVDYISHAWRGERTKERREEAESERQPRHLADAQRMCDEARNAYIQRTVNAWRTAR